MREKNCDRSERIAMNTLTDRINSRKMNKRADRTEPRFTVPKPNPSWCYEEEDRIPLTHPFTGPEYVIASLILVVVVFVFTFLGSCVWNFVKGFFG
jgi:hypothetical protein